MSNKPKLQIYNSDGTVTEVEPIKMWHPCHYKNGICGCRFLLSELERKDEVIEEQKRELFYKSQEITELREKSWQDQQWFKQASANITEMQKELDRIEREHAEERAAHNAHVAELCELEQERNMYKASSEVFYERLKKVWEERETLIECLLFYERLARGREVNDGGRRARTLLAEIGVAVK